MGYAIPRINKLKTEKDLSDAYKHNTRSFHVLNADPERSDNNVELVDQLVGKTYQDVFEETVRRLKVLGAQNRSIRKDAIRGFELLLTYSWEDVGRFDLDDWARANVEWIRETFNPPGRQISFRDPESGEQRTEKIDNLKSAILHMDETVPHIHAFVVPIDAEGRLNAHYYTRERSQLVKMQDSYAKAMEPFGLKRGARHSVARHEQTTEYYRRLLMPLQAELPPVQREESAEQYRERANNCYRTEQVHHAHDKMEVKQKIAHARELLIEERGETNRNRKSFENEVKKLAAALRVPELNEDVLRDIRRAVSMQKMFEEAVQHHPDQEKALEAMKLFREMVLWQQERENLAGKNQGERINHKNR